MVQIHLKHFTFFLNIFSLSVMTHAFNFSKEAVADRPLGLCGYPNLYSEFQDSWVVEAM